MSYDVGPRLTHLIEGVWNTALRRTRGANRRSAWLDRGVAVQLIRESGASAPIGREGRAASEHGSIVSPTATDGRFLSGKMTDENEP
jgi:hypothetical protein